MFFLTWACIKTKTKIPIAFFSFAEPVPPTRRLVLRLRLWRSGQVPAGGRPGGRQALRLPGGKTTNKYPCINTNKLLFFAMNFKARETTKKSKKEQMCSGFYSALRLWTVRP